MTTKSVEDILTRAGNDEEFAALCFSNLTKAIAGYELSVEEIAGLQAIFHRDFDTWREARHEADRRERLGPDTPFG